MEEEKHHYGSGIFFQNKKWNISLFRYLELDADFLVYAHFYQE